jgi:nitrile hydratase accessory protein
VSGAIDSIGQAVVACGLPESSARAFSEPWQAQLFAITVAMNEAGHFSWPDWAGYLSGSIRRAQAEGDPDLGDTFWLHWLDALECLLRERGLASPLQLAGRREALRAYSRVARAAALMNESRTADAQSLTSEGPA